MPRWFLLSEEALFFWSSPEDVFEVFLRFLTAVPLQQLTAVSMPMWVRAQPTFGAVRSWQRFWMHETSHAVLDELQLEESIELERRRDSWPFSIW